MSCEGDFLYERILEDMSGSLEKGPHDNGTERLIIENSTMTGQSRQCGYGSLGASNMGDKEGTESRHNFNAFSMTGNAGKGDRKAKRINTC